MQYDPETPVSDLAQWREASQKIKIIRFKTKMRLEERNKNTKIEKDIIIHYIKEKKKQSKKVDISFLSFSVEFIQTLPFCGAIGSDSHCP